MYSKIKIYGWIIIILIVLNVSTIGSFYYHYYTMKKERKVIENMHHRRPPRFLKEDKRHHKSFFPEHNKYKHNFRLEARALFQQMDRKRLEILNELSKEEPDTLLLDKMAIEFGEMHKDLKLLTINFYLNIKEISTKKEQEELYRYFHYLLKMDNSSHGPHKRPGNDTIR